MGRKRSYTPLNVFLNGRHVGQLIRERTGVLSFAYDHSWLEWEHNLPASLSLPLQDNRYVGDPVIAVFDNLLPDNEQTRRRLAECVGAQGTDPFSLLSEIGRDCVGALQFLPDGEEPQPSGEYTGDPVDEDKIESILKDLKFTPLGIHHENDFRISVAGFQHKTALLFKDGEWIKPTGATPTTHILKPQMGQLSNGMDLSHSVENEYLCLKLMEGFGLRTAQAEVKQFGSQKVLAVKRFDRLWTKDGRLIRLPQEDCCQALSVHSRGKYQIMGGPGIVEIMNLLDESDGPEQDRLDFFKANILFWLIGATDGHAKNFSVALMPGGHFRMTPIYDVLTVQPDFDAGRIPCNGYRLAMQVGKSGHYRIIDIMGGHFQETGIKSGLSRDAVESVFEDIRKTADEALESTFSALPEGFPPALTDSIGASVKERLKLLG